MYNGIGLQTARGSGTNGYVQTNLANLLLSKVPHLKILLSEQLIPGRVESVIAAVCGPAFVRNITLRVREEKIRSIVNWYWHALLKPR